MKYRIALQINAINCIKNFKSMRDYINFIIKMNKSKSALSQTKSKQKITVSTPTNKKSTNKLKEKPSPCSPRANRIHTL